ncbi:DEAD/DEAH box helicase family protein [Mucilaginibacter sp. RCC_168]|uniref:DEAD/DEAH box helicase family protein n=1 Tax=unclassified Mucilaginibacter TaxID=2617802 RepID=UPI00088ACD24|nr:DEAD/DEAH box helicase family protein [Mucilaginibacter sp. OK268]SDP85922.1 hypothetical protein SAMN05428975_3079 [Mucilaginibacter sp. OK268]
MHNITFDKEIVFPIEITRFTEIPEVNPIPSNTIIYKTVCGLGATHSEIVSKRDSIIILPHLSIVKSKHNDPKYKDSTFAVHGEVTVEQVYNYLASGSAEYRKLLTTPAGLKKIIKATQLTGLNYKSSFFVLIDECHKLIQDAGYRGDMLEMMENFFQFDRKAMISATPIPPSDSRLVEQKFKHYKVTPDFDYKKGIKLINSNSVISSLKQHINENPSECYFIFFNSVSGILSLIKQLKIKRDVKIFCSEEYKNHLKDKGVKYAHSLYDGYTKYNFLTSSFYNGLDINIADVVPNVIIISDCSFGNHCIVDPFTDVLQISGRFREIQDLPLVHINNVSRYITPLNPDESKDEIVKSKKAYETLSGLKTSFIEQDNIYFLDQALKTCKPYFNLLDENGNYSYFLQDNYLDENRVSQYYSSTSQLMSAYVGTTLFKLKEESVTFNKDVCIKLSHHKVKYLKASNKNSVATLQDLEAIKGTDTYYKERLRILNVFPITFNAYERLGIEKIISLNYNRVKMQNELLELDIKEKKNSYPLIDLINKTFQLNKSYLVKDIKKKLQELHDILGLSSKAKSTDITLYFHIKPYFNHIDSKSARAYILMERKYNSCNELAA